MFKRLLRWLGLVKEDISVAFAPEIIQTEPHEEPPVIQQVEVVVEKPVKKKRKPRKNNRNS